MKQAIYPLLFWLLIASAAAKQKPPRAAPGGSVSIPRLYILPQGGFEFYLSAAMVRKQVPVVVVKDEDQADYILESKIFSQEEKSAAGKVARCIFLSCIGIDGTMTATVQLMSKGKGEVLWAYNVRKLGAMNYQSSSEAVAKHLKKEFFKKPRK